MTIKKANELFLTIVLVNIGVSAFFYFMGDKINIGILPLFLLSEGILMIPAILFLLAFGKKNRQFPATGYDGAAVSAVSRPFEAAAFHEVKISSFLMIILCTFLVMPLVIVLNALSMLFADNAMAPLQGLAVYMPFPVMWFFVGILGPFCEEFVFRGVIYRSYRRKEGNGDNISAENCRSGGIRAILLSAFLFGLMHMNFNQMIYAFAMGILLALLVEAAGSLWASVFCHVFFNSVEVVLMYASRQMMNNSAYSRAAEELTASELLAALSVYLVIAAVTTPIAICVIIWIAKNEGRQQAFAALFSRQKKPESPQPGNGQEPQYFLSIPLIVAIVLCFGNMSLEFFR